MFKRIPLSLLTTRRKPETGNRKPGASEKPETRKPLILIWWCWVQDPAAIPRCLSGRRSGALKVAADRTLRISRAAVCLNVGCIPSKALLQLSGRDN